MVQVQLKENFGMFWVGGSRRAFCKLDKPYDDCWALDEWLMERLEDSASRIFVVFGLLVVVAVGNWTVIVVKEYIGVEYLTAAIATVLVARWLSKKDSRMM